MSNGQTFGLNRNFQPTNQYQYGNFGQPNYGMGGSDDIGGFDLMNFGLKAANPYAMIGSTLLGGLFKGIGGIFGAREERKRREERERRRKQMMAMLKSEMAIPAISQSQVMGARPLMERGLAPQRNRLAGMASKRLGLDSGAAWGEIARGSEGMLGQQMSQLYQQMLSANAAKRQGLMRNMVAAGGF